MRAARVQPEAPASKEAAVAAPPDADQPKKQRKKGDAIDLPIAFSETQVVTTVDTLVQQRSPDTYWSRKDHSCNCQKRGDPR